MGEKLNYVDANGHTVLSKVHHADLYEYKNKLGREGWELVNVRINADGWYEFYDFKRPIE
jgi:hypothetical protein